MKTEWKNKTYLNISQSIDWVRIYQEILIEKINSLPDEVFQSFTWYYEISSLED